MKRACIRNLNFIGAEITKNITQNENKAKTNAKPPTIRDFALTGDCVNTYTCCQLQAKIKDPPKTTQQVATRSRSRPDRYQAHSCHPSPMLPAHAVQADAPSSPSVRSTGANAPSSCSSPSTGFTSQPGILSCAAAADSLGVSWGMRSRFP